MYQLVPAAIPFHHHVSFEPCGRTTLKIMDIYFEKENGNDRQDDDDDEGKE